MRERLTKYGKPARAEYRKLRKGDWQRDEHRHVMEQALGRLLSSNEVVHHIDGDKYNNDPSNLQVMSLAEHSRMHQRGAGGSGAKLTEDQARAILKETGTHAELARRYGVTHSAICDLRNGRTWKHLSAK